MVSALYTPLYKTSDTHFDLVIRDLVLRIMMGCDAVKINTPH